MPEAERLPMSDAEREVLKVLWEHGPKTVREVVAILADQGQQWARSTVVTLLQRLEKKGYVDSDKSSYAFVFHAVVSREEEMHARMAELADELCEGDGVPLVLAFAKRHKFSAKEIERFRDMIDQLAPKRRRRSSP